ncbi:lysylphosphatidylglycerol synthase domain-containing protein [Marinactinospora rubrisoli]|uniref:Lysylphosphatidylglycerol synthase domain-containing protein n=1 Tax=Marinactinospora rubrisoli TaxID=2715399 RepID=A0ABW2K9H4_9ACTN
MSPQPSRRHRWAALLRPLLATAFVGGAAIGMWSVLRGEGDEIMALLSRPGALPWLVGSMVVNTAGLLLGMASWRSTLTGLGHPLPLGATLRIFGASVLGKYLPGPFWSALASVYLGRDSGVPPARMVAAYVLNSIIVVLTAAVVGTVAAPQALGQGAVWLLPAVLAVAVLLWRPGLVIRAAELAARLLRRPAPTGEVSATALRRAMVLEILSWIVGGAHLWLIAVVLGAPMGASFAVCVGGFALAAAAGALALVVPGGAGVREVVIMVVLVAVLPWSQAGAAALASRLCCTVTEVVGAGGVLLAARFTRARRTVAAPRVTEPTEPAEVAGGR